MKILLILPLLVGCAGAGVMVEETDNTCTISGTLFTPTILDQSPPETEAIYEFKYEGEKCTVTVSNAD